MRLKQLILLVLCGTCLHLGAQDFHNSYWQFAPTIVNPALTGAYYGNLRVNVIGRDQGRPVAGSGNEFQDLSITADYNIDFGLTEGDWVALGLTISRSRTPGAGDFERSFAGIIGAYHLAYGRKKDKVFTIGAKYGPYSTSFNNLVDAEDTFSLLNQGGPQSADLNQLQNNIANENEKSNSDFAVGLMLTTPLSKKADLRIGIAADRILNSQIQSSSGAGGVDTMPTGPPIPVSSQRFGRRVNGFISYYNSINSKIVFNPNLVFQNLNGSTNILLQGLFKCLVNPEKEMTLSFGAGVRLVNSTDIPLYLGVDVNSWKVGVSYDTNIGGLRPSSNTFGALEIGISKVFNWKKKPVVEPKFICPRL